MPLINRIEVSNFLNSERIEPWRPDWSHQIFDLGGWNTAMNIPNGKGKSTLVLSLLSMLTGHMKSLKDIRMRHYAPRRTGHYTHIRMEVLINIPGEGDHNDMVARAGGALSGAPMVFGLYGNSGENQDIRFYSYRGTFDHCPIANVHQLRHVLVSDDAFLEKLSGRPGAFPANAKERTLRAWMAYLDDFFDLASLRQQFVYQLARGAEGASTYFEVQDKKKIHRTYAASIFYERLAPELLSEVMGTLGADDEKGIEDTIHENVSGLIVAKRNTALKATELCRTSNTLAQLELAIAAAQTLKDAESEYDTHRGAFVLEMAAIKNVLVDDPIPGVPPAPGGAAPKLAHSMVMQDGKLYLPDRIMADFTSELPGDVNRRAHDRKGIELVQANRSQLIEISRHSFSPIGTRGPSGGLYSRKAAFDLIGITTNFTRNWTREKALAAITDAFDWADANGDSNPGRLLDQQLAVELATNEEERRRLQELHQGYVGEREGLRKEQQTVGEQQAEYRRMVDSKLFTSEELADPAGTGQQVAKAFDDADKAFNTHKDKVRDLTTVFGQWQQFLQKHGKTETPNEVAERLVHAAQVAKEALDTTNNELRDARGRRKGLETALNVAKAKTTRTNERVKRFNELAPAMATYARLFREESPVGLEATVKDAHKKASDRKQSIMLVRSKMTEALAALARFRDVHGSIDPQAWLDQRLRKWEDLGNQISNLNGDLLYATQRRADLDKASVAPGRISREVRVQAGGNSTPLYEVIEGLSLDLERKTRVLTLFSALLHAPVYSIVAEAAEAAERLAHAEVESPVFVRGELEAFCREGAIAMDQRVAHTLLVGVRTRPVDCLLDPTLVDREKEAEDERVAFLKAEIGKLEDKRIACAPEHEDAKPARSAARAVEQGYEAIDAKQATELDEIVGQLPDLITRASEEAIAAIRARLEHDSLFEHETNDSLLAALEEANTAQENAQGHCNENERAIEALEGKQDGENQAYLISSQAAGSVAELSDIQSFIDHPENNPVFMQSASERQEGLRTDKVTAENRIQFRFEQADTFVRKGEMRPREIEARIEEVNGEIEVIQDRLLPNMEGVIGRIRDDRLALVKKIGLIDEWVRRLMRKYREFLAEKEEVGMVSIERLTHHPIAGAAIGIREEPSLQAQVEMILDLAGDNELEEASTLGRKMQEARHAFHSAKTALGSLVDQIMVMPELDLPEHVRFELNQAKDNPDVLMHTYQVTKANFDKNRSANDTAQAYLDKAWTNVGDWLQKFTARLPDNLETMKRVFGPVRDDATKTVIRAGFEIKAELAELKDVRGVLDEIVEMVEKNEKTKEVIENADPTLHDLTISALRRQIRDKFYQKVIKDPIIRVCMPAVSQKSLLLEKNMVSTGQGIAMTLLWIVKMADYVTERELNRQTSDHAQKGRLRANKTQFAMIDGAFSSLSKKELIRDALASVTQTDGRFQLIITDHDENYRNNFAYFPTLIEAREINGKFMYADCQTKRVLDPDEVGSHYGAMELMSLRVRPVAETEHPA